MQKVRGASLLWIWAWSRSSRGEGERASKHRGAYCA